MAPFEFDGSNIISNVWLAYRCVASLLYSACLETCWRPAVGLFASVREDGVSGSFLTHFFAWQSLNLHLWVESLNTEALSPRRDFPDGVRPVFNELLSVGQKSTDIQYWFLTLFLLILCSVDDIQSLKF